MVLANLIGSGRYDTDKEESGYTSVYEELLRPLLDQDVRLLELGVFKGGSLLLWRDYFARGLISGLDLNTPALDDPSGRIKLFAGRQDDVELLDRIAAEVAPDGFDVIIDDCAHLGTVAETSFWHLFRRHLKPGGIYVVEDWGTGYWSKWPDGEAYQTPRPPRRNQLIGLLPTRLRARASRVAGSKRLPSHDAGMVGFVKRLVDECGRHNLTRYGTESSFESMMLRTGLVVVRKRR